MESIHRRGLPIEITAATERTPRRLVKEFAKINSGGVVLPALVRRADGPGEVERTIRLLCITAPEPAKNMALNRLGLTLPRRLHRIDQIAQV